MLLGDIKTDHSTDIVEKNKNFRSKNVHLRNNKNKYVIESASPPKPN